MTLTLVPPVPPAIHFTIETRPSVGEGHSWWAVLTYRGKEYLELLPQDLPAMTEEQRGHVFEAAADRLKAQLRPVLMAEDGHES